MDSQSPGSPPPQPGTWQSRVARDWSSYLILPPPKSAICNILDQGQQEGTCAGTKMKAAAWWGVNTPSPGGVPVRRKA